MQRKISRLLAGCAMALCLCAPAAAQIIIPPGASLDAPSGSIVDLSCSTVDMQGTLNIGGTLSVDSDVTFGSSAIVSGSNGIISVGGNLSATGPIDTGNNTVVLRDGCIGNTSQISGNFVFQNLTLSSTTGRTFVIPAGANITVLGTLTLQGAPGQNIQLVSSGGGTAVINLGPGATVTRNNATVNGGVQIGGAAAATNIPTLSEYGLMLMALLMGLAALWHQRRVPGATGNRRI